MTKSMIKLSLTLLCFLVALSGMPIGSNSAYADVSYLETFEEYAADTSLVATEAATKELPWRKSCCNGLEKGSWAVVEDGADNKALSFTHTSATSNLLTNDYLGDIATNAAISAKIKFTGASTGYQAGVIARYQVSGTTASYYRLYAKKTSATAATLYLEKREGSNGRNLKYSVPSETTASTLSVTNLPVSIDYASIMLDVQYDGSGGVILRGYYNGDLKFQASDEATQSPAPLLTGRVGLFNYNGNTLYDDVEVIGGAMPEAPTEPPSAPANLETGAGNGQAHLSWEAVAKASHYMVKRSETQGGPYAVIADAVTGVSYTDTSLTNGSTYYYILTAVNQAGDSLPSNEANVMPALSLPAAPTGVTAVAGDGSVQLTWNAVNGAEHYTVHRSTTSGTGYTITATEWTGTGYSDFTVANGTTYYYVIRASNAAGESSFSLQTSARPQDPSMIEPIQVSSSSALNAAIAAAVPGQEIIMADGNYTINKIKDKHGTEQAPIIIRAQNSHGAVVTGSSVYIEQSSYLIIQGLRFANSGSYGVRMTNNKHVTIKDSHLELNPNSGSSTWIQIDGPSSRHNRVENNLFQNKRETGKFIVIGGDNPGFTGISQHDVISGNIFRNTMERQTNESEPIRIGESELSYYDSFTIIEGNLFENCDSDPEIISVKSGKNIIRYNVFSRSLGTVSLRHGNGTEVYGNLFFGGNKTIDGNGTGGVRIYGEDHKIYNNYFEGLTGEKWDAAITITSGNEDYMTPSKTLNKHYVARNVWIANNTLVNNYSSIELGFENASGSNVFHIAPQQITFANNIVYGDQNALVNVMKQPVSITWKGNMMYPTGEAVLWDSTSPTPANEQIAVINPLLVHQKVNHPLLAQASITGYKKLTAQSPAINAAIDAAAVIEDMEREARSDGLADVGADEYTGPPVLDNTPPVWTNESITYTATPRSLELSWSQAQDQVGMRAYSVLLNDVVVHEVYHPNTSYTITGLEPGIAYSVAIVASDIGGNQTRSSSVTASTVNVAAVSITGLPARMALGGIAKQLQATVEFADHSTESLQSGLSYHSAANKVDISVQGIVTGAAVGMDTITAEYKGVVSAPLEVEVRPSVQISQRAVEDTYADGGSSFEYSVSKGKASTIYIKKTGQGRVGYVKVPSLEEKVDLYSAQLQLHAGSFDTGVTSVEVEVYGILDDSWQEATLTHTNKPSDLNEVRIGSMLASTDNMLLSFDVTDFIRDHENDLYSFRIEAVTNNKGIKFVSKEGSDPAKIPAIVFTNMVKPDSSNPPDEEPNEEEPNEEGPIDGGHEQPGYETPTNGQQPSNSGTSTEDSLRNAILAAAESSPSAKVLVEGRDLDRGVQAQVSIQLLMEAAEKAPELVLEVQTAFASYELPVHMLDWKELASQLGASPDEITIIVTIEKASESLSDELMEKVQNRQASLLSEGIDFRVTAESYGQSTLLNSFTQYVTRSILIPGEVDPSKVTGILYDPISGVISFAPTTLESTAKGTMAIIKRTGNSLYAIVEADRSFVDSEGHWAQEDIELLANKWLIEGSSNDRFHPERSVSRAEFAVMLVRALGLEEEKHSVSPIHDVPSTAWHAGYIGAAVKAGLITGFGDGSFRADAQITREQMAVMLVKAMNYAGKLVDGAGSPVTSSSQYLDQDRVSEWAEQAIASTIQAGIIQGTTAGRLEPQAAATRAQAVVMLKRFLQFISFINK